MKNEEQSTAFKNEIRYYTISNNIDIETGEVIKNTKNYIKINKKIFYYPIFPLPCSLLHTHHTSSAPYWYNLLPLIVAYWYYSPIFFRYIVSWVFY